MFSPMRRTDRQLSVDEAKRILASGTFGVLALVQSNGYPFAVPLNYVMEGGTLYFHGAAAGAKMRLVREHPQACFTLVESQCVAVNRLDTFFTSVVAYGRARVLEDAGEIRRAMLGLGRRFSPDLTDEQILRVIDQTSGRLGVIALELEHVTGKRAGPEQSG